MYHYIILYHCNPDDSRRQVLFVPNLHIRKLRHREIKSLALSHTTRKWKARMQMFLVCSPDKALCCALTSSSCQNALPTSGAWSPSGSLCCSGSQPGEIVFITWGHLAMFETFLTVQLRSGVLLGFVKRSQGCCYTHSNAQGNPHHNEAFPTPGCQQY